MSRFKFWKKTEQARVAPLTPATVTRFNVTPRQDLAAGDVPGDPAATEKLARLRKRREALVQEVEAAQDASRESNRWRAEIALIDQAMHEIDGDMEALPVSGGPPGESLDPLHIEIESFAQEPVVTLSLRIGTERFLLQEDLDWAERGFQLARSDLHIEEGDIAHLSSNPALQEHLASSLIVYATDVRDRMIDGETPPIATLDQLARPSSEFGGWLDWHGHSPFNQQRDLHLRAMRAERERLESERATLITEEEKTAESLPFAQRRLAEVEAEIAEILKTA